MNGFSVFLGEEISAETKGYIKQMKSAGFSGVFTSLHIPEDDASHYLKRLAELGQLTKALDLTLMVDISAKALEAIGIDIDGDLSKLKELGVTGIRMDYGISLAVIAKASQVTTVGLNASTLTEKEVETLISFGANFQQMELWHNYYPRSETGLSRDTFIQTNQWLQTKGLKVIAFVPGDGQLRGPLYNHLPTLEEHRHSHPLASAIDLMSECFVDEVYIGDERLAETTRTSFEHYFDAETIRLAVTIIANTYQELFIDTHHNRQDAARDVIRSQEARFKELPIIKQANPYERSIGSVTLDNQLYGRYMGELQLTKKNLLADPRVNVVAKVVESDLDLLKWIKPGQRFELYIKE